MNVRTARTPAFEREKAILDADFEGLAQFFAGILSDCSGLKRSDHVLVAFVTRRCHILLQMFLNFFASFADGTSTEPLPHYLKSVDLANLRKIVDKHFLTDFNLIVQAGYIADLYQKKGAFPEVIVLDEIIVHGRAVNNLLLAYEDAVICRLEQCDPGMDSEKKSSLRNRLADATKLHVYAQNNEPLLLLPRYQRQFQSERLCTPHQIKELSQKFATLVISGNVNNVAYSWNFRLKSPAVERWASLPPPPGFVKLTTDLKFIQQDCCLWLYPNASSPKVICSIRWKQYRATERSKPELMLVPFIMYDRIPRKNLFRLHERICEDLRTLKLEFLTGYEEYAAGFPDGHYLRWLSETNDLILTYLLFRRYCGADQSSCAAWSRYLKTSVLARNYKLLSLDESLKQNDIFKELKTIWSWVPPASDQLEQYLDILLEDAHPIWLSEDVQSSCDAALKVVKDAELIQTVEDTIAFIGYEAEKNVCEKYSSKVLLSDKILADWGPRYSLSQFMEQCKQFWNRRSNGSTIDIYAVLALIVQEMDLGVIGMNPQFDRDSDTLYTMMRAGEHSLFITPTRYQAFIPVLISIDKRCFEGHLDLQSELVRFMGCIRSTPTPGVTADDLYAFMQELESINQSIKDWDFQLSIPVDFQGKSQLDASLKQIAKISYDQYFYQREYR